MSNDRATAYYILSCIEDKPAKVWYNTKYEVLAQWPKTLSEMDHRMALHVVEGLYREAKLGERERAFKYTHRPLSRDEYRTVCE